MIFAIPIAEKILAGLTALTSAVGDGAPSSATHAAGRGAAAADFARTLDQLDPSAGPATPAHGAHSAGQSAGPASA